MALTTVNITGTFNFPDATWTDYAQAEFHLSGYDTDTEVVTPELIKATLTTSGGLDVDLWGNDDGDRGTVYRVNVVIYTDNSYTHEVKRFDFGRIQISGDAAQDIADLLGVPVGVPGAWYSTITEAEYNAAIQAVDDAQAIVSNFSVDVTGLPAGTPPTSDYNPSTYKVTFAIPEGQMGDDGVFRGASAPSNTDQLWLDTADSGDFHTEFTTELQYVVQSSSTDTTAGKLMQVGAGGWLGGAKKLTGAGAADNLSVNGRWWIASADMATVGGPSGAISVVLDNVVLGSVNIAQMAYETSGDFRIFHRARNSSGWTAWRLITPESGSNANGTYTKIPDSHGNGGTLICRREVLIDALAVTKAHGALYRSDDYILYDYPATFTSVDYVSAEYAGSDNANMRNRAVGASTMRGNDASVIGLRWIGVDVYATASTTAASGEYTRVVLYATGRYS